MEIVSPYIKSLVVSALKLLLGILWLFLGNDVVASWNVGTDGDNVYWFISGLVLGLVFHAIFVFIKDILLLFELISTDRNTLQSTFKEILNDNKYAVALKNLDRRYLYANELFCDLHGISSDQLRGKTDAVFMDEIDVMKCEHEDDQVISEHKIIESELVLDKGGVKNYFIVVKKPLLDKKNKIRGIVIYRKDISDVFDLKQQFNVLKTKYKRLFDDLPFPTMLLDPVTTLPVEFNNALLDMLGYKRGEFFRTRFGLYIGENDDETSLDFINRIMKEKGGVRNISMFGKNKEHYDVEAHFKLVSLKEKELLHVIFRDITENKKATDALVQSEQNYHTLFNHANDAIFIVDPETLSIVDANELAYIWLGYDEGELNSLSIFDIDKAGLEEVTREKLAELAKHKDVLFEHEMCTYEGDIVPVEISAHTVIYANKLAYQYVVRDISERKVAEWALRESEERYWQMFENNGSIMLVTDPVRGTIEDANEAAVRFYKINKDDMVGMAYGQLTVSTEKNEHGQPRQLYEATHRLGNDEIRNVEINEAPIEIHGRVLSFNIIRDISINKEVEKQLSLANRMIESSAESVLVIDAAEKIMSVNRAFIEISGYSEQELLKQPAEIMLADTRAKVLNDEIKAELKKEGRWKGEVWNRRKGGESYAVILSIEEVRDHKGQGQKYVLMMMPKLAGWHYDSSDEWKTHSNLTGLPDRNHFADRLNYALKKSRRSGKYIAIMLVDIRRFYQVNQRDGFDTGDKLLRSVAKRMQFMTRESDYVAHFQADKFAMLLEDLADIQKVNIVSQKALSTLIETYQVGEEFYDLTFAIGISIFPEDGEDARVLLEHAESALMSAKMQNKNCFTLYSTKLNEKARNSWNIEKGLHDALKNKEFSLLFLPQFSLQDDSLSALEVLLRWQHPSRGLLEPAEFLVDAEYTGFIVAIGDWVMREACYLVRKLSEIGIEVPELVINVSASQIDEDFPEFIEQVCAEQRVDVNKIALDMQESSVLKLSHDQHDVINVLRDKGVKIQIDDFGKGSSTLAMLLELGIDRVKMDARLINHLLEDEKVQRHCELVHALSNVLGFKIIAEGVEQAHQVTELKRLQCDFAQGHYYARAMDFESLLEFIQARQQH